MTDTNALLRQILAQHADNCVEHGNVEFNTRAEASSAINTFISENIDDLEDQIIEFVIERFVG